ncbi:unnamed protein product [Rotaria socialis]|uniref:Uncharacterized protein n=2 Tax=Rotaria socialis TaxID=392032 RepID=A0A820KGA0_9BILA|nr:unnamed protein product [Rotaria socialis]CAF4882802.1 unnamed protein product [Rotaria socialis]
MPPCRIRMTKTKPEVTWFSTLFQQIDYLIIEMPIICYSIWDFFPSIINARHRTVTDDDAQENINILSQFVHLPSVIQIEFGSTFNMYRWKDIQFILKACPNVISE